MITMLHGMSQLEMLNLRVAVYRNLTRRCWSIKALEGRMRGRVIAHAGLGDTFELKHVDFKVQPAGRERVRKEHKKYVHAYVAGRFRTSRDNTVKRHVARYNPYTMERFTLSSTGEYVLATSLVQIADGRVYIAGSVAVRPPIQHQLKAA